MGSWIFDIKAQLAKGRKPLSERQKHYLTKTLERLDPTKVKHDEEWVNEWASNEDLRAKVKVISDYYATTTYYRSSVTEAQKALAGLIQTPRKKMMLSMVDNHYAGKVWQSHTEAPKWAVGDLVKVRSGIDFSRLKFEGAHNFALRRYNGYNDEQPLLTDCVCVVLEVSSQPIDRALAYKKGAGGTRCYKLLPFGHSTPFHALEMDLKKTRKKEIT